MADVKITDYNPLTTPDLADLVEIVDDVGGTPTNKKIELEHLLSLAIGQLYTTGGSGSQTPGTSYVKLTQWDTNGLSLGTTPDATNNKITLASTGLYGVFFSATFGVGATSGFDAQFRVYWNSVAQAQCTVIVPETAGFATMMGLVDVETAATDLEIYVATSLASKDIDIEEAQLVAVRLGYT